jgi:hypothetical protein
VDWLDQYEIRARIAPTVVVLSPLFFAFFFIVLGLTGSWPGSLTSMGVVALLLIYVLSFLPGQRGKKIEPALWTSWDGPPTTRRMRWRDPTLDDETKRRLRERAEEVSGVTLLSVEEEKGNPEEADQLIARAFEQVRATLREEDPEGVWVKHNAEYGANRNLLGSRGIWLGLSVLGALMCGAVWYFGVRDVWLLLGLGVEVASAVAAYVMGWHVLPRSAKMAADRYAESTSNAFLTGANTDGG